MRVRATADVNVQVPIGEPGSWLSGTAVRLNALWQDGGVAGRDYAENERKAIAPSSPSAWARRPASWRRVSSPGRTTCPTTASPAPPGTSR